MGVSGSLIPARLEARQPGLGVILSVVAEENPLLRAMGVASGADRVLMEADEDVITITFYLGEAKCIRAIPTSDDALDGEWEDVALRIGTEARDALSA